MKSRSLYIVLLLFALSFFLFAQESNAQCVMCKAVAEKGTDDGEAVAKGLNSGILYLMGIPYILILSLIFVFYRQRITKFLRELKKS